MATLVQILDTETEAETVFNTYLTSALGLSITVVSDSNTELMTARLAINSTLLSEGPHQTNITSGTYAGRTLYDQKKLSMDISLVYNPAAIQGQSSYIGTMRKAFTDFNALKTQFAVNNYYLLAPETLRQVDGSQTVDNKEKTVTITTTLEMELFLVGATLAAAT